jgi:regulator of cell morphogenesis and NO signaling
MQMIDKTISMLLAENATHGRVLHNLGVDFELHYNQSLAEVCKAFKWNKKVIVKAFESEGLHIKLTHRDLNRRSLGALIAYLKQSHVTFIKECLPYIGILIDKLKGPAPLITDLKLVFPLFFEDFVTHIHEEEDGLFEYIKVLVGLEQGRVINPIKKLYWLREINLEAMALDHKDEMKSMRALVAELPETEFIMGLVKKEFQAFDQLLRFHADIEDQLLFPKAIAMEKQIWAEIKQHAADN